jgi:Ras-related protein Rab-18
MATLSGHYDHIFKILLIGDAGVGKSSILLRFTDDAFEEHLASTIGVDFKVKTVTIGGSTVKLTIWDTAGQERFRTLTSSYYRGCHGVILTYDVNDRQTFTNLKQWLEEVDMYSTSQNSAKMLVGNKIDVGAREVSVEEATEFARKQAMMFIETSAKSRAGIRQAFEELVRARRRGTLCARALHSVAHAHPVPAASRRRCKRCSRRPISSTLRTDDQRLDWVRRTRRRRAGARAKTAKPITQRHAP